MDRIVGGVPRDDRRLETLIACPECDALYRSAEIRPGSRALCGRCHTVLISPRRHAGMAIISFALAATVLVMGALWFPFLRIDIRGLSREATLWEVATSFTGGPMLLVSFAVVAAIVLLPLARAALILYTLVPVVFDRPPARHAPAAFRLAEAMRPWSMAEIFALGCAVSLVKIADLATVSLGPAFWMFAALVVVTIAQDRLVCRWSVWKSLERR
ncbi:paraquat-inducible protein A [Rubellimicrobium sp. CFH 75288]|uniref:paraquat-inducible protein A n=1 Tax=Rubellimicrobium sp. CFH 75288 TaxID=2697034 RepID=UPI00141258A1|nr:paraquat-inducible protein A [Rubellimicrobium sp. CFH 75288]NAZ35442.1 paraquat-inducible protein A [Rubellimicrobium sp. CFH 75288]